MSTKLYRLVGIGVLLMLTVAACGAAENTPATPTGIATFSPLNGSPSAVTVVPVTVTSPPVITAIQPGVVTATNTVVSNVNPPAAGGAAGAAQGSTGAGGSAGASQGAAGSCAYPAGWVAYTVQAGDTISSLAAQSSVPVQNLITANCLTDANVINVGQVIYLPGTTGNAGAAPTLANSALGSNTTSNTAANGPRVASVRVEPATLLNGEYQVAYGSTVTLRAEGVANAVRVTFLMTPLATKGSDATPSTIGIDTNLADGVSFPWVITDINLRANVWAIATDSANQSTPSQPIIVFARSGTNP